MAPRVNKWIQKAKPKPGALHRQLGYPVNQNVPTPVLQRVMNARAGTQVRVRTVTPLMKRRANFAINVRKKK